jgi:hypothetical protein
MDETRAVARLPGLDIRIDHRVEPDAETIVIALRATPGFEAVAGWLDPAAMLRLWMAPWLAFNPWLAAALPQPASPRRELPQS